MKILFCNPPWWLGHELKSKCIPVRRAGVRAGSRWPYSYSTLSFPGWRMPFEYVPFPFFMAYAASYVKEKTDARVDLRDSIARRESYGAFLHTVKAEQYDFIFIESATPCWDHDSALLRKIHQKSPDSRLIVCGPITADRSQEIMDSLPVTACIQGEYELNAIKVINGQTGVLSRSFMTEKEMNAAPPPMYDEQTARAYYDRNPRGMRAPQLQVWGSRGCPFKCIFCSWPATMTGDDPDGKGTRLVRYYRTNHLAPFIKERIKKSGIRSVYFDDDTFNLGTAHTQEMCAMMRDIGLPWAAMCRTDTIRMETWDEMLRSGCYGVKLGFESGNQYVNDHIVNKHLDLKYSAEVVHHLKSIGMSIHGTFTIGLPGETPEQMKETLAFAKSLPLDSKQISGTAEIEGTPLHNLRKTGALDAYTGAHLNKTYDRSTDGNKKWDSLIADLKNN